MINDAIDVTNNQASLTGVGAGPVGMIRFLAHLAQVQISPLEEPPLLAALRAVALFEVIPAACCTEIEGRVAGARQVLNLSPTELLGLSVLECAKAYMFLYKRYNDLWLRFMQGLPKGGDRRGKAIYKLDRLASERYWSFGSHQMLLDQHKSDSFLGVFAQTPAEFRAELAEASSPYEVGHPSVRMQPLDRHPIVSLSAGEYIVPNLVILRKSFAPVIDFSLMDEYRMHGLDELYNQVRGACLELYLERLVLDRLPRCTLIPEMKYRVGDAEKRGPDLTIIDLEDRTLIVVEAKARRLSPTAAAGVEVEDLDCNFESSMKALCSLPGKVKEMCDAVEFKQWWDDLRGIPEDRVVLVSVVPATLFFQDDLEALRAEHEATHPLSVIDVPFCFLDLPVFERAVELACLHELPLGKLLREHHEDSRMERTGRLFRSRPMPDLPQTFVARFVGRGGR